MVESAIINSVKNYLQCINQRGIPVQYGVLFGSSVKGGWHEWSDIDLLVVSPRFDEAYGQEDMNLLWRTAAYTDSRIEPIGVGLLQYRQDDTSPILEIARREGVMVTLF